MNWEEVWKRIGRVRGVIHVGANDGAEYPMYKAHGVGKTMWVEPYPPAYERLRERVGKDPNALTFPVACGSKKETAKFWILGGGRDESNSILLPKKHLEYHPDLPLAGWADVPVERLEHLILLNNVRLGWFNLLVLDTQGSEGEVIRGFERWIERMDYVVTEINREELYENCAMLEDIDCLLGAHKFYRAWEEWTGPHRSYGDALYIRKKRVLKKGRL